MVNDIANELRRRKMQGIRDNWDEISERLESGETINLEAFVPSDERRQRKNIAIETNLINKRKL